MFVGLLIVCFSHMVHMLFLLYFFWGGCQVLFSCVLFMQVCCVLMFVSLTVSAVGCCAPKSPLYCRGPEQDHVLNPVESC